MTGKKIKVMLMSVRIQVLLIEEFWSKFDLSTEKIIMSANFIVKKCSLPENLAVIKLEGSRFNLSKGFNFKS